MYYVVVLNGRLAALLILAAALHAQSVDGTLTDSVTHAPIPGVIVTLLGPARYNDTTDEAGVFHFASVRPGKYVWNIVKSGYVLPPSRRAAFQVDSDTRLSVEMDPLCLIEGSVHYSDGRPAPRASVWLSALPMGAPRTVNADIGGRFVFDDVNPGEYVLRAAAAAGDPKAEGVIWVPTYFPSTTDRAGAEPIRVDTCGLAGHDIRLRSLPARLIRGIVRDETGRPANAVTVTLNASVPGEQRNIQTGEDGVFELLAWDGEWRISATRKDGDLERQGFGNVTVARHDVENVEIRLALPFSVPIVTEREDAAAAGGRGARSFPATVILSRVDVPAFMGPARDALQNLSPGRYLIHAMSIAPGEYVESIKLGEIEAYGRPIDIWDGSLPVRITYRRGAPVVRGTVETGPGAKVVILDADESLVGEPYRTFEAGRGGAFEFPSVRPGDYYVFALDRNDPAIGSAAFRRAIVPRAEKIHLEKGASVILNLKITPWPL